MHVSPRRVTFISSYVSSDVLLILACHCNCFCYCFLLHLNFNPGIITPSNRFYVMTCTIVLEKKNNKCQKMDTAQLASMQIWVSCKKVHIEKSTFRCNSVYDNKKSNDILGRLKKIKIFFRLILYMYTVYIWAESNRRCITSVRCAEKSVNSFLQRIF